MKAIYQSTNNRHSRPIFSVFFKDYVYHKHSQESLNSVIKQTLSTDEYEVILLTDQEDVSLYKESMSKHGVNYTIIITELISLGKSYGIFLQYCNGIFACPIDNDDTWNNERLAILKNIILEHENVAFIKNQVNVVSELGNNFYTKLKLFIKMNIPLKVSNRYYILNTLENKKIFGKSLWHNVTSMVIKVSILQEFKGTLDNIFAMDDPYIFFFGLYSGGMFIFVDKFLSNYFVRSASKTTTDRYSSHFLEIVQEYERFTITFDKKYAKVQKTLFYDLYFIARVTFLFLLYHGNTKDGQISREEANKALKIAINYRMHNFILLYIYSYLRRS